MRMIKFVSYRPKLLPAQNPINNPKANKNRYKPIMIKLSFYSS